MLIRCRQLSGPSQWGRGTRIRSSISSPSISFNCRIPSLFVRYPSPTAIVRLLIQIISPPSIIPGYFIYPITDILLSDKKSFNALGSLFLDFLPILQIIIPLEVAIPAS